MPSPRIVVSCFVVSLLVASCSRSSSSRGSGPGLGVRPKAVVPDQVGAPNRQPLFVRRELEHGLALQTTESFRLWASADVDGDGDEDVFLGVAGMGFGLGQNRLFLNDGRGHFVDKTSTHLPRQATEIRSVAFADIDGDDDPDLILGAGRSIPRITAPMPLLVYENDGAGVFTALPSPAEHFAVAMLTVDVDKDRDLDLIVAEPQLFGVGGVKHGGGLFVYRNDGHGVFEFAEKLSPKGHRSIAAGDIDGDGDMDFVSEFAIYINDGQGGFADELATRAPGVTRFTDVRLADVDRDGDPDLIEGMSRLFLNNRGVFEDATAGRLPKLAGINPSIDLADLDGDGDVDFVICNDGADWYYLNDGTGRFRVFDLAQDLSGGQPMDLDLDGDLDFLANVGRTTSKFTAMFNRTRDLHVGGPAFPGQLLDVQCTARPAGILEDLETVLAMSPRRARVPVPGIGWSGLDPNGLVVLSTRRTDAKTGVATHRLPIADDPNLLGTSFYLQAHVTNGLGATARRGFTPTIRVRVGDERDPVEPHFK